MNETTKRMALIIGMIISIVWSCNMRACAVAEQAKSINYLEGYANGMKTKLNEGAKDFSL